MPPLQHFRWANHLLCNASRYSAIKCNSRPSTIVLVFPAAKQLQIAWKSSGTHSAAPRDESGHDLDCKPKHAASHHHDDHHHEDPQAHWYQPPVGTLVPRTTDLKWPQYVGSHPVPSYRGAGDYANEQPYEKVLAKIIRWIFWWTFWYNILIEPGHVFGEYYIPNRYKMTDAELGVPPLD